jgi:hypothetical protein
VNSGDPEGLAVPAPLVTPDRIFILRKISGRKNMDELAYKSSNKKSKPVQLENYTQYNLYRRL